jgi:hypothetical protein
MIAYGGFKNIITSGSNEKLWAIGLAASSNQYIFSAKDFLFTKLTGGIDTQIGIGFFACVLVIFGAAYFLFTLLRKKTRSAYRNEDQWVVTTVTMLVITFLGVNGARLPIRLVPLRWWAFFALPFAIFSAYSILKLTDLSKKRVIKCLIILVFIVGIIFTSFISRYTVQTAQWPPHVWSGLDELKGYLALRDKPYDNIFPLCSPDCKLSFINKLSFLTNDISKDKGYFEFKAEAFNKTPKETHNFLLKNNLKYVLIDSTCVKDFGMNTTNDKIREMQESGLFAGEFSTPGAILIKPV